MVNDITNNNIIQSVIEQQLNDRIDDTHEDLDFDPLFIYFGDDYVVDGQITIHQPTIQDFIDYRSDNIYGVIAPFITNTTGCRVQLWDMGVDWNKISNIELFSLMIKNIDYQYSKIIFGDTDFSAFNLYSRGDKPVLYNPITKVEISEETFKKTCKYIQWIFHAFPPEEEFTSNRILKQELINNDRQKRIAQEKDSAKKQSLLSMISFCLNHPGFKYTKNELRNVCIAEFMDSVQRLQLYESTRALYNGMYSGFVDTSKIQKSEFDFMRDVSVTA